MQGPMQPVIEKLRWSDMKQQKMPKPLIVVHGKPTVAEVGEVMNQRSNINLQDDEIIPIILSIDLLVFDPICLYPGVLRNCMNARNTDEKLGDEVPNGGRQKHVSCPIIFVVVSCQSSDGKGSQQEILE